ncbi:MAG: pentapeptide repeat-containing protein [Gammaproteobacteria bacterium]|nr:pentapeptide repeat-containing protein [Gammaproteobacteria bacterium]
MKKSILVASALLLGSMVTLAHAHAHYSTIDSMQFKITNSCMECDLSGAEIGPNHSNATLTGSNLSNAQGYKLNLSNSNSRHVNFSGAYLVESNFSQSDLTGSNFDGANVAFANFAGSRGTNLANAKFCNTIMPDGSTKNDNC